MKFNPDKCEVLSISRKKHPVTFPYDLHGQQLNSTEAAKYLGVTISKDLYWTNHINNITTKASFSKIEECYAT
jgi:myo-inositol-hexaphosphate 3-phosphohydrolase